MTILLLPSTSVSYQVPYQTTEKEINKFLFGGATPSFIMNPYEVWSSSPWQMHSGYDIYFSFTTDNPLDIYLYNSEEHMKWDKGQTATPTLVKKRLNTGNYSYPVLIDAYAIVIENNNPSSASVENFTFGEIKDVQVTKYRTEYRTDYTSIIFSSIIFLVGLGVVVVGITKPAK